MILVLSLTVVLVVACVILHYESLNGITQYRNRAGMIHRRWITLVILGALLTHIVEVSLFAGGYALLDQMERAGQLMADSQPSREYWYFSFAVYTSLGFGDITPQGPLRYLAALETLAGLVLIAWTSSFVFVEMQRAWEADEGS